MEEDADDDMYPFAVHLKQEITLEPRQQTCFYAKVVHRRTHTPVENSAYDFAVRSCNLGPMVLAANSVGKINNGNFPITLANFSNTMVPFEGNELVAFATIVEPVELADQSATSDAKVRNCRATTFTEEEVLLEKIKLKQHTEQPSFPESESQLIDLLWKHRPAVALPGEALGKTPVMEFEIELIPGAKPVHKTPYKMPHSQTQIVNELLEDMKKMKVIEPSNSPYSSPIILVKKKDGGYRPCIDYRALNLQIVADRFPLADMNTILQSLGDSKVFSSIDLFSSYWQLPLTEESKRMTAFSANNESWQFTVLPFGIKTAVSGFSRLMRAVLSGLLGEHALSYLDDVILFTPTVDLHLQMIDKVLQRFQDANLKIKLVKCQFLKKALCFLGNYVSSDGVRPDPAKLAVVKNYPVPTNVDQLRSFLGFVGFYRQYIDHFSQIAKCLTNLFKKDTPFKWGTEEQTAFELLRDKLISDPILVYPDFKLPFFVATDASNEAIAAALLQERDGTLKPIGYASRTMTPAEFNYGITDKEGLALLYGLQKFRNLIYGYEIICLTDHLALCQIFAKGPLLGRLARWALTLQDYAPRLRYVPGKLNRIADSLSRMHPPAKNKGTQPLQFKTNVEGDAFIARIETVEAPQQRSKNMITNAVCLRTEANPACFTLRIKPPSIMLINVWSDDELVQAQTKDPFCIPLIKYVDYGTVSPRLPTDAQDYFMLSNVLHKKTYERNSKRPRNVVVMPAQLMPVALQLCHDSPLSGHYGIERTLHRFRERYYFPGDRKAIAAHYANCKTCLEHKGRVLPTTTIFNYPIPTRPFEVVSFDTLGPFTVSATMRYRYILVFVCFLTHYCEVVGVEDRTAEKVAFAIRQRIIMQHGTPKILISDRAAEFCSTLIQQLCKGMQIKRVNTCVRYPAANGLCERANGKVLALLRSVVNSCQDNWDECLPEVQGAINSAYNISVGDTPHFLLYHFDKVMPFDLMPDTEEAESIELHEYVKKAMQRRRKIIDLATMHLRSSKEEQALYRRKDAKRQDRKPYVGQRVYIKVTPTVGIKSKLTPKWKGPYRIEKVLPANRLMVTQIGTSLPPLTIHLDHVKFTPEIEINATFAPSAREPFQKPRPTPTKVQEMPSDDAESLDTVDQTVWEIPHPPPPTQPPTPPPATPPSSQQEEEFSEPQISPPRTPVIAVKRPINRRKNAKKESSQGAYQPPKGATPHAPSGVQTRSQLAGIPSGLGLYAEYTSSDEE